MPYPDYARAYALLEESLLLSEMTGDVRDHAFSLMLLGLVLHFEGDPARAYTHLQESLSVSREVGYKRNIGLSIYFLGIVTWMQGDVARARSLLEESLVLFKEVGERGRLVEVLSFKGFILFREGDHTAARVLLEEGLKISLELDYQWDVAECLELLAAVAAAQGEAIRAVWCMSAAQVLREAIGTSLPSMFQAMHEFTSASVRKQLGEQAFDAAWAEGRAMAPEQVLTAQWPTAMPAVAPAELLPIPQTAKALTHPNGLTAREMDVLRLLVQGLTSAQIAERLVIGLVTVNSYVRSIYSKLGVTSRAAATRYALEHHLL